MNKPQSPHCDAAAPPASVPGARLHSCADWVTLAFERPRPVLSNAVLGGGLGRSSRWLNLRVSGDRVAENPQTTLAAMCHRQGWAEDTVAMMTAAAIDSLRVRRAILPGLDLAVFATTGLSNARRAGDRAEFRRLHEAEPPPGTINLAIVASARLAPAVMVEALVTATEAKAAALQEQDIRSPVSGRLATGTGTDAIALFSGDDTPAIPYAGKHTLFGEVLARLCLAAIGDSICNHGPSDALLILETS